MDRKVYILFIAAFAVFMLPFVLRLYYFRMDEIVGTPTFYHTRIAEGMIKGVFYDNLSFGGRPLTYPPLFSVFQAAFGLVMKINLGGMVFVALFGALGICAAFLFSRKYFRNDNMLFALLLVITPGIIFLNSHISTRAPPIALGILSLYLLSEKRYLLSGISLGISFLFHPEPGIIFLIVCLVYAHLEIKCSKKNTLKFAIPAIVVMTAWYVPFVVHYGIPQYNALHEEYRDRMYSLESPTVDNFLWESGKGYFTIPLLVLAVIGFYRSNRFFKFWAIVCFALALAAERFFFDLLFPIIFLSAFGIIEMKSRLNKRHFYYMIIVFVVAYTAYFGLSRSVALAKDYPIQQQIDAFHWMRDNTPIDSVVLSDWQWGHWISGIAQRKNFVDGYAEYAPSVNQRISELHEFYNTCKVPSGYGINYIYMEDWFAGKYGINCLGNFSTVYSSAGIKIYKI